jgi:hypothetical protein
MVDMLATHSVPSQVSLFNTDGINTGSSMNVHFPYSPLGSSRFRNIASPTGAFPTTFESDISMSQLGGHENISMDYAYQPIMTSSHGLAPYNFQSNLPNLSMWNAPHDQAMVAAKNTALGNPMQIEDNFQNDFKSLNFAGASSNLQTHVASFGGDFKPLMDFGTFQGLGGDLNSMTMNGSGASYDMAYNVFPDMSPKVSSRSDLFSDMGRVMGSNMRSNMDNNTDSDTTSETPFNSKFNMFSHMDTNSSSVMPSDGPMNSFSNMESNPNMFSDGVSNGDSNKNTTVLVDE